MLTSCKYYLKLTDKIELLCRLRKNVERIFELISDETEIVDSELTINDTTIDLTIVTKKRLKDIPETILVITKGTLKMRHRELKMTVCDVSSWIGAKNE